MTLRLTRVGLILLLLTLVIAIAATNTGNNGLFLAVAATLATFAVAQVAGWLNLRNLEATLDADGEIFANRATAINVKLKTTSTLLPGAQLIFEVGRGKSGRSGFLTTQPVFVARLAPRASATFAVEAFFPKRGRFLLTEARVSTLFPFGIFHKTRQIKTQGEVLIFPEVFPRSRRPATRQTRAGDDTSRRLGRGHDLAGLRPFVVGDDPRSIHWKQTARQGQLILRLREAEEQHRLAIVFDNAVGELRDDEKRSFEHLVSEAASAALDFFEDGFEVALRTRDLDLGFGSGPRHRHEVLAALALIETRPKSEVALEAIGSGDELRLALDTMASAPGDSDRRAA